MTSVLLVDDDPILRMATALAFESAGWRVTTACDGAEALDAVFKIRPNLVVTDIVMPNEDGLGLIRSLKQTHPKLPIIAVSGHPWLGALDVLELAAELGADAVVQKPFPDEVLLKLAAELLLTDEERASLVA